MGGCYLGLGRRADAVRAYERAVSNHDAEGIATRLSAGWAWASKAGMAYTPFSLHLGSTDGTLVLPRVASRRRADMSFVTDETDGTAVARLEVIKANQSIQSITISLTEASTI